MNLWRILTEPHPGVTGERERRQARQFSGLVLGLLVTLLILMAIWAALPEAGIKWPELVLLALLVTSYGLSRTKAVRAGTILTIVGMAMLVGATATFQQDATPAARLLVLGVLLIPLLLSTLLTDARVTAAVGVLNIAVIGASALLMPGMASDDVVLLLGINIAGAILAVAVAALRQRDIRAVEQQMRDRQRDLDVTARISEQVSTVLDLDRLLPQMVDLTKDSFGLYHVHVYLYEPDTETLRVAAGTGEAGRIMQESGHSIPLSARRSLVARAGRSRQPVLIPDVALEPDHLPNPLLPLTRSEMAVPLVHGEDLIGVLDAQSEHRGAFSEDTVPVMTTLAGQMAVAIINARAFTAIRQAQEETQAALDHVARQNRFSSGVAQFATTLLNRGIDGLGEALGPLGVAANASRVYFFENFTDGEGRLACRQVFEWVAEGIAGAENPHVPYETALPHWKDDLFAGRPVRALRSETPPPERTILDEQDIESLLLIPIMVEGSFYGFVGFDDCQYERVWDEAEIDLLQTAGVSIAYAISGARLLQRTQEALLQVEMLYQVSQLLVAAQSPEQMLAALYEAVKPAGPAGLSLFYFDASGEGQIASAELAAVYQAGESLPMSEPGTRFTPADLPLIDLLAANPHRITAVSDAEQPGEDTPPALVTMLRQAGLRAAAFVPLVSPGQRWVGAVTVGWRGPHTLAEAEENLLTLLAPQLATVAENLRLLHRTQRSEGLLRSFIDASPDWIWAKDRDFRFLIANKAFAEQAFGTTPEDVVGKDDYAFAPAELVDGNPEKGIVGFRVDDLKTFNGEIVHNPYDVVVHKDGSQHILDTTKFPLRDKDGNIIGTMGMGRDMTEQHRARERERLAYELGQQLTRLLTPDELLHATVEQVASVFGYYHAHIYLLDEEGEQLVVREGLGEAGQTMKQAGHRIPLNATRSLVARAARTREPVVVNDVARNPDHLPNPLLPLTRSEAAVPLVIGERLLGVLDVQHSQVNHFDEHEIRTLGTLASQLAVALSNAELYEEQAQTADQMRRQQKLLRTIIDSSPDWIWAKDRDFRFLIANKAFAEQAFGTTPEDVVGKDDYAFAPAELVDGNPEKGIVGFRVDDLKTFNGEIVHNPYDVVVHKDGSQHILDTTKFPLYDDEGRIIGTVGMGRDITEQHRARERERLAHDLGEMLTRLLDPGEQLRTTVERLSQTFGYYHAHIYLLDEEGEQLVVREGLGEAGQTMKQAGHRIPLNATRSLVARAARTREPVVVNDVARNPDHLPNPLLPLTRSEAAVPLVIGERLLGVLDVQHSQVNHFDEHEIVMLSIVANQLAIALSNAELYQEQLETTERLREVDKLKSEFLANVSHELRTPLNSIIGYSELLIDEMGAEMDEMSLEDLKAIHSSGYHLLAIINDILDLAKIEAGRLELHKEPVALDAFIPQVIETTRVLLKDKPAVELLLEMPDSVPTIEADPVRLRQILWNLLSNAIKFTDQGHVRLTCRPDDGWMQFIVEDTGIGIPPDQKDAIFDQFRQIDGSPTRKQGGTGLGLTITRELVTMHGGTIALDSDVGRGTTFTVRLPLESAAPPKAGATQPQAGAAQPQKQANGREAVSAD